MNSRNDLTECTWVDERIDAFTDGELDAQAAARLEGHTRTCPRCRAELTAAVRVLDELRSLHPKTLPGSVARRLRGDNARGERLQGRIPGLGVARPVYAAMLAILIVASVLVIGRIQRTAEQATPEQIERAEAIVKWTFAYVTEVSRRAGYAARDDAFAAGVIGPAERAVKSAMDPESQHRTLPEEDEEL